MQLQVLVVPALLGLSVGFTGLTTSIGGLVSGIATGTRLGMGTLTAGVLLAR